MADNAQIMGTVDPSKDANLAGGGQWPMGIMKEADEGDTYAGQKLMGPPLTTGPRPER